MPLNDPLSEEHVTILTLELLGTDTDTSYRSLGSSEKSLCKNLWFGAYTSVPSEVGNICKQITGVPINASGVLQMIWET